MYQMELNWIDLHEDSIKLLDGLRAAAAMATTTVNLLLRFITEKSNLARKTVKSNKREIKAKIAGEKE